MEFGNNPALPHTRNLRAKRSEASGLEIISAVPV